MAKYYSDNIELFGTCVSMSCEEVEQILDESKKANGSLIRKMIKEQLPNLYEDLSLNVYNEFESQSTRTDEYYIYVHSAIEYFLRRS